LLDYTFITINPEEIFGLMGVNIDYLEVKDALLHQTPVSMMQHVREEDLAVSQGSIRCAWGCDYLHELNTESGSPICTTSDKAVRFHTPSRHNQTVNIETRIRSIKLALTKAIAEREKSNWWKGPRIDKTTYRINSNYESIGFHAIVSRSYGSLKRIMDDIGHHIDQQLWMISMG
jgi:hypothetical protein